MPGLATVAAPMASDELVATVHDPEFMDAVRLAGKDPYRVIEERGLGTPDNPTFEGMHEASAHVVGATVEAARRVWTGKTAARREHLRRPAPRDARARERLLRLQRRRGRHPVAARPGRRAGGVRRPRRAPRGRRGVGVLRRPAGPDDQPARDRADAVPGHRLPQRHRRAGRRGQRGQRGAAAGHVGRRLAAGVPRGRPAAGARVRARRAVHPVGVRLAHRGPACAPDAHRGRPAGGVPRAARPGPRGVRRQVGGHRRGRLRRRGRRAAARGRTCWRSSAAPRWTRPPRRRTAGASTCSTCWAAPARTG